MINPTLESTKNWYFVKNGVIFDISSSYDGQDSCAFKLEDENLPKISVGVKGETGSTDYYLDCYIERGDTYNAETSAFSKTIHSIEASGESSSSFTEYFKYLCEEQIKDRVSTYTGKEYPDFSGNTLLLGIPEYMLSGNSKNYEVSGVTQINFTEEMFNEYKVDGLTEKATDSANAILKQFGYKVKTLEIEK